MLVHWNCKSIHGPARFDKLKQITDKKKPHIISLQETWLQQHSKSITLKGYKILRKDRTIRGGGGLLFAIREDIQYKSLNLIEQPNSDLEAQAIEVSIAHDTVHILNIYNPPHSTDINHLDGLIQQLGRKYIIVGDFNGKSTLWDPAVTVTNQCGRELATYITDHLDMALITTPGLKTYTDSRTGKTSTLDLAMCSNNLIHVTEISLLGDSGSDHTPVKISLALTPDTIQRRKRPKWKLKDNKIQEWKEAVQPLRTADNDIATEVENYTRSLTEPAQTVFGKTSGLQKTKFSKPWWTPECSKVVAQRRRARKTMERRPTIANIIEYKKNSSQSQKTN